MLVNETTLVATAVDHDKGCFLGQETVAKVRSGRGAAYAPVLLRLARDINDSESLVGAKFSVRGRKGGVVRSWVRWHGEVLLYASLYRDFRIAGEELVCDFGEGSRVRAHVAEVPLVRGQDPREKAETLYHRAVELFTRDLEEEAMRLLERAVDICPGFADAYESLGVIHGRRGEYERAIELMERLLEVDADSVMAHTNMSVYYNRLGRIEDAEREAVEASRATLRRRQAEHERVRDEQLRHEARLEELRRREDMFLQVLALDPEDALGDFGMGELCVEGRFEDARCHLDKALHADSDYSAAYLALGRAWEGMLRPDMARETYEQGVAVAARRGDLLTANRMQERLATLGEAS